MGINKKAATTVKLIQHTQNLRFEFLRDHEFSALGFSLGARFF